LVSIAGALALGAGCQTSDAPLGDPGAQQAMKDAAAAPAEREKLVLREGDTIRISFPGAPNLNTVQPIRRDGRVALQLVGEVVASGLTPSDLEKRLLELYGPQLQTKEVSVALESSAFPVYVTGAVQRPGKIISDRPLTAVEAIMEAGGFNYSTANLKGVRIIRHENGKPVYFHVNMKPIMNGQGKESFPLKPSDIIYVPERFSWF
jgi:polysaccharide export outer membrane protein